MIYEIKIGTPLITLNEYIKIERGNRYAAAKKKKDITASVSKRVLFYGLSLPKDKKFDVHFIWIKPNNRADHDNIAMAKKFVLDGIVKSGALQNDSPKFIRNFTDKFILDRTQNFISCVVKFEVVND